MRKNIKREGGSLIVGIGKETDKPDTPQMPNMPESKSVLITDDNKLWEY